MHAIASTNIKTLLYSREIFISFDFVGDGINGPYTKLKYTYVLSTSISMAIMARWAI